MIACPIVVSQYIREQLIIWLFPYSHNYMIMFNVCARIANDDKILHTVYN